MSYPIASESKPSQQTGRTEETSPRSLSRAPIWFRTNLVITRDKVLSKFSQRNTPYVYKSIPIPDPCPARIISLQGVQLKLTLKSTLLLALSVAMFAEAPTKSVAAGSKIFIEAADGFDTYLTAALQKKSVPVVVVSEKEKADYELAGVSDHQKPGWAKVVIMGQIHSDEQASIKLINLKSGEVVFAYSVNKKNSLHGRQTAAEACAKHMKEVVSE